MPTSSPRMHMPVPRPSASQLTSFYDTDTPGFESDTWSPQPYNNFTYPYSPMSTADMDSYFSYQPLTHVTSAPVAATTSSTSTPSTPSTPERTSQSSPCTTFLNYPDTPNGTPVSSTGTRKDRRRQQNRLAQKKYRQRKESLITELQQELDGIKKERDAALEMNVRLLMEVRTLRYAFMPGPESVTGCAGVVGGVQGVYDLR